MFASLGRGLRVALEEMKKSLRHKKKTLGMIVIPLVFIFLLTTGFGGFFEQGLFIDSFSVAVVNEDQHPMAHLLMDQIRGDEGLQELIAIVEAEDGEAAEEMVGRGEVFAGVVIPEDFVGSLERGESRELILYTGPRDPFKSQVLTGVMESFMYSVSAGQSGVNAVWDYYREQGLSLEERREKIAPVIQDITFRALNAQDTMMREEQVEGINTMDPGVYYLHSVVFSLLLFAALFLGRDLIREKELGLMRRVPFTGTSIGEYYGGKILGHSVRMILFGGGFLIAAQYLFFSGWDRSLFISVGYLSLWILLILSGAGLLALLLKKTDIYFTLGNFLVFSLILLGGGLIPYYYLPYGLDRVAAFLPNHHYLQGIQQIRLGDFQGMIFQGMLIFLGSLLFFILGVLRINRGAGDPS